MIVSFIIVDQKAIYNFDTLLGDLIQADSSPVALSMLISASFSRLQSFPAGAQRSTMSAYSRVSFCVNARVSACQIMDKLMLLVLMTRSELWYGRQLIDFNYVTLFLWHRGA
jgi:hypothetical protein